MTKKHFELLAKSIRMILDPHARLQAAVAVAVACNKANSRFDEQLFFNKCGIDAPTSARRI